MPADVRFEYHRTLSLKMGAHVELPRGAPADFLAESRFTATADGIGFVDYAVDPCVTRFGAGGGESMIEIGLLYAGTMRARHGKDQTTVLQVSDGPVLVDATRPMATRSTYCAGAHLQLPRATVVAALGGDTVPRGAALRRLGNGRLCRQFTQCLRSLHGAPSGAAAQVDAILHTAQALALVTLANTRGAGHHWPDELEEALYATACHQLLQRMSDPHVTVDAVAAIVQCSRAQLYRLFAARGQSVAGYLRELRMQRGAQWLVAQPRVAIGTIADHCGYSELVTFDRAFRRRFGMTPRDWRAEHQQSTDAAE